MVVGAQAAWGAPGADQQYGCALVRFHPIRLFDDGKRSCSWTDRRERRPTGEAGLGLDTRQYNGRTTSTDMLWGGVPYVTVPGASLASRVASSLAVAHGVPDLLAHSEKEYEDLAVAWSGGGGRGLSDTVAVTVAGKDGEGPRVLHIPRGGFGVGVGKATMGYLSDRRKQVGRWRAGGVEQFEYIQTAVEAGRELGKLFDTAGWVEAFEKRLGQAWQRHLVGRPLTHLGGDEEDDDGL